MPSSRILRRVAHQRSPLNFSTARLYPHQLDDRLACSPVLLCTRRPVPRVFQYSWEETVLECWLTLTTHAAPDNDTFAAAVSFSMRATGEETITQVTTCRHRSIKRRDRRLFSLAPIACRLVPEPLLTDLARPTCEFGVSKRRKRSLT